MTKAGGARARRVRAGRRAARVGLTLAIALSATACRRAKEPPRTLRIAVPYEVTSLDPHASGVVGTLGVLSNVYEALVATDAERRLQPALAESWENPDATTWVFRLRPGVRFHSGRVLSAADVLYSLTRPLRNAELDAAKDLLHVADVAATDPLTLRLRTRGPAPVLLNDLSHVFIVPEGRTEAQLAAAVDGTGPYRVAAWQPGKAIHLVRHEGYWSRPASMPDAEYSLDVRPEEALAGLLAGRYALIHANSRSVEAALAGSPRHAVLRAANPHVKYLGFDVARRVTPFCNVRPNPFRDIRVRQAIQLALDTSAIAQRLSAPSAPAAQLVPRFVLGFEPGLAEPEHDAQRARSLMAKAGLSHGFEVVLHTRRILEELALRIAEDLAQIGVRVHVRALPDSELLAGLKRSELSFWLNRVAALSGDAGHVVVDFLHSPDPQRQLGLSNATGYSNRELDVAIEASDKIDAPEQRRMALQAILARALQDLPLLPVVSDEDIYALERSLSWRPRADGVVRPVDVEPARPGAER